MSRATPRKPRHRQQPSNSGPRQIAASDYESDAAQYLESRDMAPPEFPPPRDNTELSLRVMRRYQPSIRSIIAIAANAVAYTFQEATQGWEKHGAEGTMFVCELEPIPTPTGQVLPRSSVYVLNRRSMDNLEVDLLRVTDCEVVGELIVFRLDEDQSDEGGAEKKVIGLWIHADESNTREVHASLVLGAWQQGRLALDAYIQALAAEAAVPPQAPVAGRSDSAGGRQLNVADLFGQKNGGA
jgi:hypothetical protein